MTIGMGPGCCCDECTTCDADLWPWNLSPFTDDFSAALGADWSEAVPRGRDPNSRYTWSTSGGQLQVDTSYTGNDFGWPLSGMLGVAVNPLCGNQLVQTTVQATMSELAPSFVAGICCYGTGTGGAGGPRPFGIVSLNGSYRLFYENFGFANSVSLGTNYATGDVLKLVATETARATAVPLAAHIFTVEAYINGTLKYTLSDHVITQDTGQWRSMCGACAAVGISRNITGVLAPADPVVKFDDFSFYHENL